MNPDGQFNKVPKPKSYTDYTPAERERLVESIRKKMGTKEPLTEEEKAFRILDMEYWEGDSQPHAGDFE